MERALSEADRAFRDQMRTFFTTEFPAQLRGLGRVGGGLSRDQLAASNQALNETWIAGPRVPLDGGSKYGTDRHR